MFNGKAELPEGWAICDGTNGTPNLVGKFIKAVASADEVGDNDSILDENNGKFIKAVASADEVGDNDSILDENNELILS
jgi:hypothetical protein